MPLFAIVCSVISGTPRAEFTSLAKYYYFFMAVLSARVVSLLDFRSLWALVLVGLVVVRAILRKYWTPIRDIPGPFLASFSKLWQVYHLWKGHIEEELIQLHKEHGIIPWMCIFPCALSNPSDRVLCPHRRK